MSEILNKHNLDNIVKYEEETFTKKFKNKIHKKFPFLKKSFWTDKKESFLDKKFGSFSKEEREFQMFFWAKRPTFLFTSITCFISFFTALFFNLCLYIPSLNASLFGNVPINISNVIAWSVIPILLFIFMTIFVLEISSFKTQLFLKFIICKIGLVKKPNRNFYLNDVRVPVRRIRTETLNRTQYFIESSLKTSRHKKYHPLYLINAKEQFIFGKKGVKYEDKAFDLNYSIENLSFKRLWKLTHKHNEKINLKAYFLLWKFFIISDNKKPNKDLLFDFVNKQEEFKPLAINKPNDLLKSSIIASNISTTDIQKKSNDFLKNDLKPTSSNQSRKKQRGKKPNESGEK
ncbi:MAG: hypothetical protein ACRC4M_04095 [Mycoplasma sp.]